MKVFLATKFANIRKKDDPTYWKISGTPHHASQLSRKIDPTRSDLPFKIGLALGAVAG
jgi:hypothetical protein